MSEQTCPKCGFPIDQCKCSEVITVRHEGLGEKGETGETVSREEYEEEKSRREEAEKIIEAQAMVELEKQKQEFLALIEDPDKRKQAEEMIGDDPEKLENAKAMTDILVKGLGVGGVKIKGEEEFEKIRNPTQSGIPPYKGATLPSGAKQIIDQLYGIMNNPKASNPEKLEANRKLDEIWTMVVKGFRAGRGIPIISVSGCPQCGNALSADAEFCDGCGWQRFKKIKTGRKR